MKEKTAFANQNEDQLSEESSSSDKNSAPQLFSSMNESSHRNFVGPITKTDRITKVRKYLVKKTNKYNKQLSKGFSYTGKRATSYKKLRLNGRFLTKEEALKVCGLSNDY